jgi:hypothetical protein
MDPRAWTLRSEQFELDSSWKSGSTVQKVAASLIALLPIHKDPYMHGFLDAGRGNILAVFGTPQELASS